ncbi:MAG TPA: hypothetical protein VK426_04620, partial [Methanobacterium sp.]|nr:hypothetical protein [Methanobacterium sp.]
WGNTIFLFDAAIPYKDVINELNKRKLIERLNSFEIVDKRDFIFKMKIKFFTFSPQLYYWGRKLIKR